MFVEIPEYSRFSRFVVTVVCVCVCVLVLTRVSQIITAAHRDL